MGRVFCRLGGGSHSFLAYRASALGIVTMHYQLASLGCIHMRAAVCNRIKKRRYGRNLGLVGILCSFRLSVIVV
jgi:hypothetical protein